MYGKSANHLGKYDADERNFLKNYLEYNDIRVTMLLLERIAL